MKNQYVIELETQLEVVIDNVEDIMIAEVSDVIGTYRGMLSYLLPFSDHQAVFYGESDNRHSINITSSYIEEDGYEWYFDEYEEDQEHPALEELTPEYLKMSDFQIALRLLDGDTQDLKGIPFTVNFVKFHCYNAENYELIETIELPQESIYLYGDELNK